MPNNPPKLIAIDHDDYHAEFIGKAADGRQFFLTTPFEPAIGGKAGEEFVALYLFDKKGVLVETKIETFGPRDSMDENARQEFHKKLLSVALYLFDKKGVLVETKIETFGPRDSMDENARQEFHKKLLSEIGPVKYQRIKVAPFSVEKFGTTFGLVPRTPEDDEDEWAIEAQPGNYMAFFEPWDSGEYDT